MMKLNVSPKHLAVLRAALIELDLRWRRGAANAGFSDKTDRLLSGIHESEPLFIEELLKRPGAKLTIQFEHQDAYPETPGSLRNLTSKDRP